MLQLMTVRGWARVLDVCGVPDGLLLQRIRRASQSMHDLPLFCLTKIPSGPENCCRWDSAGSSACMACGAGSYTNGSGGSNMTPIGHYCRNFDACYIELCVCKQARVQKTISSSQCGRCLKFTGLCELGVQQKGRARQISSPNSRHRAL